MSEMIQRVANALLRAVQNRAVVDGCDVMLVMNERWMEDARAAIEAMREPTEAMTKVGKVYCHGVPLGDGSSPVCAMFLGDSGCEAYRRMIDEALRD